MAQRVFRIPPLAITAIFGLVMWLVSLVTPRMVVPSSVKGPLALVIAAGGAAVGFSAIHAFRKARTSVNPIDLRRTDALVTTGIFRLSRNPMYLAMLLFLVAFALWLSAPLSLVVGLLFVPVITRAQIVPEEHALSGQFGSDFLAYTAAVRRWI